VVGGGWWWVVGGGGWWVVVVVGLQLATSFCYQQINGAR